MAEACFFAGLKPIAYSALAGFAGEDFSEIWPALTGAARATIAAAPPLRPAVAASAAMLDIAAKMAAMATPSPTAARHFIESHYQPFSICPGGRAGDRQGFLTGYYEPEVEGSLQRTRRFREPILARPRDFPRLPAVPDPPADWPYPDRAAIETGSLPGATPVLWVADAIEAFMIHVQGSARVRLDDGELVRLTYDGRNGHAYTSIGRILVEKGEIGAADMSLERLKAWVREHGQEAGSAGRALLRRNRSFIFFRLDEALDAASGPRGGAGAPLVPLRSIAIDRSIWPYGLPFWLESDLPWKSDAAEPFGRLTLALDTGSAIIGPARADLFFGSGEAAGRLAGGIRHACRMVVLLPKTEPAA